MKIIFAHPRHEYGSYVDYRALVRLSGFETCFFDEMNLAPQDTAYIVSPANNSLYKHLVGKEVRDRGAKIFWLDLERPDPPEIEPISDLVTTEVHATTDSVLALPGVTRAWVSDRHLASMDPRRLHMVLGSHPDLCQRPPLDLAYDLCHMCYIHGRREVIRRLSSSFRVAPSSWGVERDRALRSSRAILNVHQTESHVGEPLRFALAAAYGLPLLSETLHDSWPLVEGDEFLSFPYQDVSHRLNYWLNILPHDRLSQIGRNLRRVLTVEYPFRKCVEDAVERSLR